jgi:hypothetical protein
MDPFTLAILFGTSALASKLGGASTKDALKGAVVNTGINALLPGAGTTGNPFIANVAKATGQDALKMMLVEGAKQGLMQRAGKKFGIDPMLLGIGANFASSYLPQNLQNVGMPTGTDTSTMLPGQTGTGGQFAGATNVGAPIDVANPGNFLSNYNWKYIQIELLWIELQVYLKLMVNMTLIK